MSTPTIQFITQVKLAELRRQRSLLVEEYDRVAGAAVMSFHSAPRTPLKRPMK
jgi:hypothetical protein